MDTLVDTWNLTWLVVEPTHLKNVSQIGASPQVGMNIKNIWNHHPVTNDKWETNHEEFVSPIEKICI